MRTIPIELFRVGNLLPPRGNEEGGYELYDKAQAAWEQMQTAALVKAVVGRGRTRTLVGMAPPTSNDPSTISC